MKHTLVSLIIAGFLSQVFGADDICHLRIEGCPESFDGLKVEVPLSAVAIHREIRVCEPEVSFQGAAKVDASIVFVIDDSPSMRTNDKNADRYSVTKEILDEIYAQSPKTRVGVVTFRNWLAWDWQQDPLFQKIDEPGFSWNDSYFPLTRLDTTLQGNVTGLEKIKSLFTMDDWNLLQAFQTNDSTERTRPIDPTTGLPYAKLHHGTDITLAFMAAKDALESSPTPKERQFIVFLSDGLHGRVDVEMESIKTDYINGTNVPTTFTVFLGDSVQTVPTQLSQMMANIKNSGYTTANSRSQLWSVETSHDTLLTLMKEAILTKVFQAEVTPISSKISNDSTQTTTDSTAIFARFIPLQNDTTRIDFSARFAYVDTAGVADVSQGDTTVTSTFHIVRSQGAPWNLPSGMTKTCYQRSIVLVSHGDTITGPIKNKHDTITVYMTHEGLSETTDASLTIQSSSLGDQIDVPLTYDQGVFVGTFTRALGSSPTADNMLQHALIDSLVFLWDNPELPLDSFRESRIVIAYDPVTIESSTYLDTDGDGYIDIVRVETAQPFNPLEIDSLTADRFTFPAQRALTFQDIQVHSDTSGFDILVNQSTSAALNTAIDPTADSLRILRYEIGPFQDYIEKGSYPIRDSIAPVIVSATYYPNTDKDKSDSLVVKFSEPVPSINTNSPFTFRTSDGTTYTMVLSSGRDGGSSYTFEILSINPGETIPSAGDTVGLAGPNILRDNNGNIQDNPAKTVLLQVQYPDFEPKAYATPNPFVIGESSTMTIPGIGEVGSGTMVVLQVAHPQQSAEAKIDDTKTRFAIYDAVGNLVTDKVQRGLDGSNYYFHWDGRNHNDRLVGSGTYLGIVSITLRDGNEKKTKRVKIGVKR